jgi:hypothetical protein
MVQRRPQESPLSDEIRSIDWRARKIKIVDSISTTSLITILAKFKPHLFNLPFYWRRREDLNPTPKHGYGAGE